MSADEPSDKSGEAERDRAAREEEQRQKRLEAEQAALQRHFEMLQESVMSERELELAHYEQQLADLQMFREAGLADEDEYNRLQLELEAGHQERLSEIHQRGLTERQRLEQMSFKQRLSMTLGNLASITAGVSQHSRTMFEINKGAALAQAAVSLPAAILESWNRAGGYPWGIPAAAAMAAAGLAQINAIRSASFSGKGGAAPSLAGSTPAPPVTPVGAGGSQAAPGGRLIVQGIDAGSLFSGRDVRDLVERLLEYQREGGTIVVNP